MAGSVLILAEQHEGRIGRIAYELLTHGRSIAEKLGCPLAAAVFGADIKREGIDLLFERGADIVYLAEDERLRHYVNDPYANVLTYLIRSYEPEVVLAGATTMGRSVMPYVASRLDTGLTADCVSFDVDEKTGNLLQTRPAVSGNILVTVVTVDCRPQMATVRPRAASVGDREIGRRGELVTVEVPAEMLESREERLAFQKHERSEADIESAERIVSGGRGFQTAEDFKMTYDLAHRLGAAVGATRDVVDLGWADFTQQIGLSGKTVVPRLYMAIGLSGAIQHITGMRTSETIVTVNIDPDAPIFSITDFGIVGDLFEVLPVLMNKLDTYNKLQGSKGQDNGTTDVQ